jgi:hypothetical protein
MGERNQGLKYFFKQCSKKYSNENINNISYNTNDRGNENENKKEYSMCYNKNNKNLKKYCGPDWTFYHWPSASIYSFHNTKEQIILESNKSPTIDKVGWFGNIYSPLPDVIENKTRPLLKKIGDEHPELFDIVHIGPISGKINNNNPNYISLPDLIKYKYLIDIGGNGYSGRLKFLLFSKRPLLLVDRNYIEYFQDDLVPYEHYIPVKKDLSDLLEKVYWIKSNPKKSIEIANNAFQYAITNLTEDEFVKRVYDVYNNLSN